MAVRRSTQEPTRVPKARPQPRVRREAQRLERVEAALTALGSGFLQHAENKPLRTALRHGRLTVDAYYMALLRVVYRVLCWKALERRGVVPGLLSLSRRGMANDPWKSHKLFCHDLGVGRPEHGIPQLGGPFAVDRCVELDACMLSKCHFVQALDHLQEVKGTQIEELGRLYECLLDLEPQVLAGGRTFRLQARGARRGGTRKSSGSYYTPDALVQALLDSALEPLLRAARHAGGRAAQVRATLALRVIDPACGTGHMLIAVARRMARQIAELEADGQPTPRGYRCALRRVLGRCIFGVDKDPLALDIAMTGFWLESAMDDRPAGFFDHHLRCGDSLMGLLDLQPLLAGIPPGAYKPLVGDDRSICRAALRKNRRECGALTADADAVERQVVALSVQFDELDQLEDTSAAGRRLKVAEWHAYCAELSNSAVHTAAQLFVAAYLGPKCAEPRGDIPTTRDVHGALAGDPVGAAMAARAAEVGRLVAPLHWPLAFPGALQGGGFDLVIMNPPWERFTVSEQEFFGARHPHVAQASNKARRAQEIHRMRQASSTSAERQAYEEFYVAKRAAAGLSNYAHDARRFALSGQGDVNTYALFAETAMHLRRKGGRAGVIVPSGIASDAGTRQLFAHLIQTKQITAIYDFENREGCFPEVDQRYRFCLLTLGEARSVTSAFYLRQVQDIRDPERRLELTPEDLRLFNPNTGTAPTLRSRRDLQIARKIYRRVPIFWDDNAQGGNAWDARFLRMFDMANDSNLFVPGDGQTSMAGMLPLYEAKMLHQFDHRWATYDGQNGKPRALADAEKQDAALLVAPRYFVATREVEARLSSMDWPHPWLMAFRDIARATDARTMLTSAIPLCGVGHQAPLVFSRDPLLLMAQWNSLVFDYCARQKVGGTHLTYFIVKQLPTLPPAYFDASTRRWVENAVRRLQWPLLANPDAPGGRPHADDRAILRAELDAFFAAAYGLERRDLAFILDPQGEFHASGTHPGETFGVLKRAELRAFGEYRTQRLVLEAWDRMVARGDLPQAYAAA